MEKVNAAMYIKVSNRDLVTRDLVKYWINEVKVSL
jgi:hypothetical protein